MKNVPYNISMILIFILEETHEAFNYFRTEKWLARISIREMNLMCWKWLYNQPL